MEYASRAVGNAIGALNGAGGLDLLNFGQRQPRDEGSIPVNRHDMGLYREISERDFKIASLESNKYTDERIRETSDKLNTKIDAIAAQHGMRFDGIQQQLNAQAVWNATQQGLIGCIHGA